MIIQSREQYANVLDEIERLWEASKRDQGISWQEGDKLDTLLLAAEAYETLHFPKKVLEVLKQAKTGLGAE